MITQGGNRSLNKINPSFIPSICLAPLIFLVASDTKGLHVTALDIFRQQHQERAKYCYERQVTRSSSSSTINDLFAGGFGSFRVRWIDCHCQALSRFIRAATRHFYVWQTSLSLYQQRVLHVSLRNVKGTCLCSRVRWSRNIKNLYISPRPGSLIRFRRFISIIIPRSALIGSAAVLMDH